jgi:hypothetical protein
MSVPPKHTVHCGTWQGWLACGAIANAHALGNEFGNS